MRPVSWTAFLAYRQGKETEEEEGPRPARQREKCDPCRRVTARSGSSPPRHPEPLPLRPRRPRFRGRVSPHAFNKRDVQVLQGSVHDCVLLSLVPLLTPRPFPSLFPLRPRQQEESLVAGSLRTGARPGRGPEPPAPSPRGAIEAAPGTEPRR